MSELPLIGEYGVMLVGDGAVRTCLAHFPTRAEAQAFATTQSNQARGSLMYIVQLRDIYQVEHTVLKIA